MDAKREREKKKFFALITNNMLEEEEEEKTVFCLSERFVWVFPCFSFVVRQSD